MRWIRNAKEDGLGIRARMLAGCVAGMCCVASARAHDHPPPRDDHPLGCNMPAGEACFYAAIDDFHTPGSHHPDAAGEAFFVLNAARTELRYQISIDGLQLKANPADRTEPDDVIGVHLHLFVPDTVGPHVLNIFGLATYDLPAEDDADLVVDYHQRTLTGIYDDGDATIDPTTGEPYLPFFPLPSKPLTNWLDALFAGDLMVAVHTNATGFPTMAIHGHIGQVVPEPSSWLMALLAIGWLASQWRRTLRTRLAEHL